MAKTFLWKIGLFLFPFALMLAVPVAVFVRAGEFVPVRVVVERQATQPLLYGPAYSNATKVLKLEAVRRRDPETIALGSSRVFQFRAAFFAAPERFYNAGGTVGCMGELARFLAHLPADAQLKVVIIGLDQWWFNSAFDSRLRSEPEAEYTTDIEPLNLVQQHWHTVWRDLFQGKLGVRDFLARRAYPWVGLNALVRRSGFMPDGSYYGKHLNGQPGADDPEFELRDTLAQVARATERYAWQEQASGVALEELHRLLAAAHDRGLTIVGFLPPFAPTVATLLAHSGHYGYMHQLPAQLRPLFASFGYALFDFTDVAPLGATDQEFYDGVHGSDKTYLRMMVVMANQSQDLAARVDASVLRRRLDETTTNYVAAPE